MSWGALDAHIGPLQALRICWASDAAQGPVVGASGAVGEVVQRGRANRDREELEIAVRIHVRAEDPGDCRGGLNIVAVDVLREDPRTVVEEEFDRATIIITVRYDALRSTEWGGARVYQRLQ